MKKYEYAYNTFMYGLDLAKELNLLAQYGWRVVHLDPDKESEQFYVLMEREVKEPENEGK